MIFFFLQMKKLRLENVSTLMRVTEMDSWLPDSQFTVRFMPSPLFQIPTIRVPFFFLA